MVDGTLAPQTLNQIYDLVNNQLSARQGTSVNPIKVEVVAFLSPETSHDELNNAEIEISKKLDNLAQQYRKDMSVTVLNGTSYYDLPQGQKKHLVQPKVNLGFILPISLYEEKPKILKFVK